MRKSAGWAAEPKIWNWLQRKAEEHFDVNQKTRIETPRVELHGSSFFSFDVSNFDATYEEAQKVEVGKSLELFKKISRDERQHGILRSLDIVVLQWKRRLPVQVFVSVSNQPFSRLWLFCSTAFSARRQETHRVIELGIKVRVVSTDPSLGFWKNEQDL